MMYSIIFPLLAVQGNGVHFNLMSWTAPSLALLSKDRIVRPVKPMGGSVGIWAEMLIRLLISIPGPAKQKKYNN